MKNMKGIRIDSISYVFDERVQFEDRRIEKEIKKYAKKSKKYGAEVDYVNKKNRWQKLKDWFSTKRIGSRKEDNHNTEVIKSKSEERETFIKSMPTYEHIEEYGYKLTHGEPKKAKIKSSKRSEESEEIYK